MLTKPNISYTIVVVSRYMQNPKKPHFETTKKILRYTKGTIDFSLSYLKSEALKMVRYCDVDYTKDHDAWISTFRYIFKLGLRAIA